MPYTADQFKNSATSRLIGGATGGGFALLPTDTTFTIVGGSGANFSSTTPFMLAMGNLAGTYELMQCTNRAGDVFTVVRGQEGTLPQTWPVNTLITEVITAGSLNDLWTAVNSGRSYNVMDYGAKGDGITNDTVAIQAAITACCTSGGGEVFFPDPQASYLISSTLTVTSDNVVLRGQSWGAQLLAAPGWTSGSYMVQVQQTSTNFRYGIRVSELFFNGNNVAGVYGLDLVSTYGAYLDHLRMRFIKGINVHWDGSGVFGAYNYMTNCHITDGGDGAIGVQTDNSEWLTIQGGLFGFFVGPSGTAEAVRLQNLNCRIIGTSFDKNDTAVHLAFAGRNIIDGCQFDRGGKYYIYSQGAKESVISNNFFGNNISAGATLLRFDSSTNARNIVHGNTVETGSGWQYFVQETAGIGSDGNLYTNNQPRGLPSVYLTGRNANSGFNVREFGAAGDGVADDTLALNQALLAASSAGGGTVLLPPGTYRATSTLTVNADNVALVGSGWGSVLKVDANWNTTASPLIWYQQPNAAFRRGCILRDFSVDGQSVTTLLTVIQLDGVRHADINHIEVHHAPNTNLSMFGNQNGGSYGAYNTIRGCTFRDSFTGTGISFNNSEWCTIEGCQFVLFNLAGSTAIHNLGGLNNNFVGNQFDAVDTAIFLDFSNYCTVSGNQFDEGNTQFIRLKAAKGNTISGNTFNSYTNTTTGASVIFVDLFGINERNVISGNAANLGAKNGGPNWGYFYKEGNSGSGNGGAGNLLIGNTTNGLPISVISGISRGNLGYNPLTPIATPAAPGLTSTTTGGTIPNGTYQAAITYVNAFGETKLGATSTVTTIGSSGTAQITLTPPGFFGGAFYGEGNAQGYYVYMTQASGTVFTRQNSAGNLTILGQQYTIGTTPTTTGAAGPGANTSAGIATPAMPANGSNLFNNLGVDVTVYLTGGSVNGVSINSVATGLTSGMFRVPPGGTILVQYSATPTWQWLGE